MIDGLSFPTQKGIKYMEEWRVIPGYESLYEASNLGRIRSIEGKTTSNARYSVRHWKQRVLKQKYEKRKSGNGKDARVILWKDGKEKTWLVSRLIALTWCEGYRDGLTVNHINGNTYDNSAQNLEWITLKDNIKHGYKNGLYDTVKKKCVLVSDDEETVFDSLAEASIFLGRPKNYIRNCKSRNRQPRSVDGKLFKLKLK